MATTITIGETPINATYALVGGATSGAGTGAKFNVTKTNGVYTTVIDSANLGVGYVAGDTITVLGTGLGGTTANNDIITVATVGVGGKIATFGVVGTGRIGNGTNTTTIAVTGTTGVDTYTFTGKSTDFTIVNDTTNKQITAASTLDTTVTFKLADHERVVFSDKATAFDITGVAGDVYALLKASIGGTVNKVYQGIGISLEDTGSNSEAIANAIISSTVFKTAAGGSSNETFVKQIYTNVIGVAPTLAQQTVYTDQLDAKTITQAQLLAAAAHLTTFQTTIGLIGINGVTGVLAGSGIDYTPV
ncbi:Domain of unknown function DUF4214 [uncultured Caudovirales phage]|uniref:DUF4214 domain-containing protein n=1 Tax=uncultured Caudovirales phage TaxID=2100421 RepID=A0A6J7WLN3_9CAUD|nr:Domain of unknown function DUF4214 [uncultured Caudovirales phage]